MTVHAAFGGSTNLLLHIPAVAHAAGLRRPMVADWIEINRRTPRLVSALPNGPIDHPTVRVFLAGGVPEVMLYLRDLGLLELDALTARGARLGAELDAWRVSERRKRLRQLLHDRDGVAPEEVIFSPEAAAARGLPRTMIFPTGNLAPDGSVVKATAIDPSLISAGGFRRVGRARVFVSEVAAMRAIKGHGVEAIRPGDVIVLAGCGPAGTGMEETYQLTSALKHLSWGKEVSLVTDARFSGVSTGVCLGHVGPEALAGGPLGKLQDGDLVEISLDLADCGGSVDLVGREGNVQGASWGDAELARRPPRPDLAPAAGLPDDTRLWAAMQRVGGGTWGGCVYDAEALVRTLEAAGG
jgi:putative YjhG/YagF family dehydratase